MKYAQLLSTLALTVAISASANAASGVVVSKSQEFKGKSAAELMKRFGKVCDIQLWHPAIAKCEETNEAGSPFRTLTLKDGGKIKEKITGIKATGYTYKITESPLPVKDYMATFAIEAGETEKDAKVTWTASFSGKGKTDAEAKAVIEGIFADGLKSIAEMANK